MMHNDRRPSPGRAWCAVCLLALGCASSLLAQQPPPKTARDGLFISVPNPITNGEIHIINLKIEEAFKRKDRRLSTIVFDFNPDGQPAATTMAGSCIDLKSLIEKYKGQVTTIAFVHGKVTRHSVLPVLACQQLLMSSKGAIGDVGGDSGELLSAEVKKAYETVAKAHHAQDLVFKMLEPATVVRQVITDKGTAYVEANKLQQRRDQGEQIKEIEDIVPALEGGRLFSAEQARKLGFCQGIYEERVQVAEALKLPPSSLREDWLVGRNPIVWRVDLRGTVSQAKLESLKRRIRTAIQNDANFIILHLDAEGGDTAAAAPFAEYLRTLKNVDSTLRVRTVAYVPPHRALGAATYLALGCNEIVMAASASLGDFAYLKDDPDLTLKAEALVKLAEQQGYPRLLFQATLDKNLELYRMKATDGTGAFVVMDRQQMQDAGNGWKKEALLAKNNLPFLKIDAPTAKEWGLALHTDVESPQDLYGHYNLDASKVRNARDDWMDRTAEFFREPIVSVLLILIGITALIIEIKLPGIGLAGVIAGLCLVLFFWAHSFVGQYTMLAVLLFLLGLVLIGLEVFIMPGFGVAGVSGIILLIGSLTLVTLERMPSTSEEWVNLGTTLLQFGLTLVGSVALAMTTASFLPHIPYVNRLLLRTPEQQAEEGTELLSQTAMGAVNPALLGAVGIADTPLRPAGKARIGDDLLDVVSDGEYINPGTRVQVIEIEGNRIVVKQM